MIGFAVAFLAVALPAAAQIVPQPGTEGVSCADFLAMDGYDARLQALSGVQPLGDEIDPSDPEAGRQWADAVAGACEGKPGMPIAEAAEAALRVD